MKTVFVFFFILFLAVAFRDSAYATHIRAGQITAVRDASSPNTLTYIFTLTLYRENLGVDQPDAELFVAPIVNGDFLPPVGQLRADANVPRRVFGSMIDEITYTFRYTFSGAGQFVIYFQEENRNPEIVNMSHAIDSPFYVETTLLINASLGSNNTPYLLNPPIDFAHVGQKFCHNPAAFDVDGDSIAYHLAIPSLNSFQAVSDYKFPHQVGPPVGTPEAGGDSPTFAMNALTGDVCWDSPGMFGIGTKGFAEYAIAFVVEEWRKTSSGYVKLSTIKCDMQITVRNLANIRPVIAIPKDTIVVAGASLRDFIHATDANTTQQIRISSESAVFSNEESIFPHPPAATLSYNNHPPKLPNDYIFGGNPAQSQFVWQTNCAQVRNQPYDVVFKAEDNMPSPGQLADSKSWRIFIIGTPPANVRTTATIQTMKISWDTYTCHPKAMLYIWRKESCAAEPIGVYSIGTPSGYTFVGKVDAAATTFIDNLAKPGISYSYLVSASMENTIHSLSAPASCSNLEVLPNSPTVAIVTPANDASFAVPASIEITTNATATTTNGTITKVEFYSNGTKIGEDNTAPYSFNWKNGAFGSNSLIAKAIDNVGAVGISNPVGIRITDIVNGSEEEEEAIVLAYPNPFHNEINIRYTHPIRELTLINYLGVATRLTYESLGNHVYSASATSLAPGMYILKIRNEKGRELLRKLVKW